MEYHVKNFWFIQQYFDGLINHHWDHRWDKEERKNYNKNVAKARKRVEKLTPIFTEFIRFVYDNGGELPESPSSNRTPFIFVNWDREKYADDIKYPFPIPRKKKK